MRRLTFSPLGLALFIVLVLAGGAAAVLFLLAAPGWTVALAGGLAGALALALVVSAVIQTAGDDDGDRPALLTCPACGIKVPKNRDGSYECYNCGREFSELSGRHPILPEAVAPSGFVRRPRRQSSEH